MKTLSAILLICFGCAVSQDVSIPGGLLDTTTLADPATTMKLNDTDYDYGLDNASSEYEDTTLAEVGEETTEEIVLVTDETIEGQEPSPDDLRAIRDPNCVTVQPELPVNKWPLPPIEVPAIVNSTVDEFVRDKFRVCPVGTVQNGSVCVASYSSDCPVGYIWTNDRCVLSQTICPLNFDWNGSSCVEQQICPHNHVWQNGRCIQPTPVCPGGWSWNGDRCEVTNIVCQSGSVRRGNKCVIESFTCPIGFDQIGSECVAQKPICLPGFVLDSSGFCSKENLSCPLGSTLVNGQCVRTVVTCPPGSQNIGNHCYTFPVPEPPPVICPPGTYKVNNKCYLIPQPPTTVHPPITTPRRDEIVTVTEKKPTELPQVITTPSPHNPDIVPPVQRPVCPDGFILQNNLCYKCPPNYQLCSSQCVRSSRDCGHGSSSMPNININIYTRDSRSSSSSSSGRGYNIVNNVEPINNTIININNVTHPVTLNNVNENNIFIYQDAQCPDGSIRTIVVKNNQTINGCVDVDDKKSEKNLNSKETHDDDHVEADADSDKCCEVVTPRQCKKRAENSWVCTHRRYKYCGKFCIADRLYLKPPSTSYSNSSKILTIAPSIPPHPLNPCFGRHCPPIGKF